MMIRRYWWFFFSLFVTVFLLWTFVFELQELGIWTALAAAGFPIWGWNAWSAWGRARQ